MDKSIISKLRPEERRRIAVAYLVKHSSDRPESTKGYFDKLKILEETCGRLNMAISKGQESIAQMQNKFYQSMGSIDTLSELVAECLSEIDIKTIDKWCEEYTPKPHPGMMGSMPQNDDGINLPGQPAAPSGDVDIAGSTASKG